MIYFLNRGTNDSGSSWYTRSRHLGTQLIRSHSQRLCVLSVMWHMKFHARGKQQIKLSWPWCLCARLILCVYYVRYRVKRCAGMVRAEWLRPWMHVCVCSAFVTVTVKNSLIACTVCVCVCVYICPQVATRERLSGFSSNLIRRYFAKICWHIPVLVQTRQYRTQQEAQYDFLSAPSVACSEHKLFSVIVAELNEHYINIHPFCLIRMVWVHSVAYW
jgi:hypothetical protein